MFLGTNPLSREFIQDWQPPGSRLQTSSKSGKEIFVISGSSAEPDPRCLGMDPLSRELISKTGSHLAPGYGQAANQVKKLSSSQVLLQNYLIQDRSKSLEQLEIPALGSLFSTCSNIY